MCSYRLESFLRVSKYKLKKITVHLGEQRLRYDLAQSNNFLSILLRKRKSEKQLESVSKMEQLCERFVRNVKILYVSETHSFVSDTTVKITHF